MDIQKEREAFEAVTNIYHCIYNADLNYYFSGSKFVGDKAEIEVNAGWKAWQAAKDESHKQAALYQSEINHLAQANQQWREKAAKAQAVPEWIETAIQPPEEGQKVIISGIYGVGIAEFSYLYKDEFVMYDMGVSNPILSKDQVKFWMPLPDAPQEPAND